MSVHVINIAEREREREITGKLISTLRESEENEDGIEGRQKKWPLDVGNRGSLTLLSLLLSPLRPLLQTASVD